MTDQKSDINRNEGGPVIYKRFDDGFIVREMLPSDTEIVQKWYCGMGIISKFDLDVALKVFPPGGGFYMGEIGGEIVASAIRIPWSDNVFYGSYYFVAKEYRGKGYGTRLRDQVAKEYVGDNILCVDAVQGPLVAGKNKSKFGYEFAFHTRRLCGIAKESYGITWTEGSIVKAADVDFEKITAFDDKYFITQNNPVRHNFLKEWIQVAGGGTYIAMNKQGDIVGMGCRRPCIQEKHHQIGPLYAENHDIAEALLQEHCKDISGENVTINIWVPNQEACSMGEKFNLECVFDTDRMHVNGDPKEFKGQVFCLTSIDICGF